MIIALLSTIALVSVMCRRLEVFSAISLLLFTGTSIFVAVSQRASAKELAQDNPTWTYNKDSNKIETSVFFQIISIPLYATIHNFFAL